MAKKYTKFSLKALPPKQTSEQLKGSGQLFDFEKRKYLLIVWIEIHICIFNKMQITGFKHKYPTIEFNSENPKKEC